MRLYSNRERPFHLGPLALERLRRQATVSATGGAFVAEAATAGELAIAHAIPEYSRLFGTLLTGSTAAVKAPVPDDPATRANNLKSHA